MMHVIHLMLERGLHRRGRRRDHRRADGPPEERAFPHRRRRRPRHLRRTSPTTATSRSPKDEERDVFEVPGAASSRWSRRSCSATRPTAASTRRRNEGILTLDPKTLRVPAAAEGASSRRSARPRASATSASGCASVLNAGDDRGRRVRAEGALRDARLLGAIASARSPTTSSTSIARMRWGFGWELGPFETWDALGVAEAVAKMEAAGISRAGWVDEMLDAGRASLLRATAPTGIAKAQVGEADPDARRARCRCRRSQAAGGLVVRRTTAPRSAISATASLGLEFHSKMNAIDPDIIAMMMKARRRAPRRRSRAGHRQRRPSVLASAPTSSWW